MPQLKSLSPTNQTKVLKLHHEIFSESACKTCKGACCESCGNNRGYLTFLSSRDFKVLADKYGFKNRTGFQTETGCALPVTERSDICLGFMCSGDKSTWPEGKGPAVSKPFPKEDRQKSHEMSMIFWPERAERAPNPVITKSQWGKPA